jgi:hypothetical protein
MATIILNKDAVFASMFDLHVPESNAMCRLRSRMLNTDSVVCYIDAIDDQAIIGYIPLTPDVNHIASYATRLWH